MQFDAECRIPPGALGRDKTPARSEQLEYFDCSLWLLQGLTTAQAWTVIVSKVYVANEAGQVRLLKGQIDDRRADLVGDLVPDTLRSGLAVLQSFAWNNCSLFWK